MLIFNKRAISYNLYNNIDLFQNNLASHFEFVDPKAYLHFTQTTILIYKLYYFRLKKNPRMLFECLKIIMLQQLEVVIYF